MKKAFICLIVLLALLISGCNTDDKGAETSFSESSETEASDLNGNTDISDTTESLESSEEIAEGSVSSSETDTSATATETPEHSETADGSVTEQEKTEESTDETSVGVTTDTEADSSEETEDSAKDDGINTDDAEESFSEPTDVNTEQKETETMYTEQETTEIVGADTTDSSVEAEESMEDTFVDAIETEADSSDETKDSSGDDDRSDPSVEKEEFYEAEYVIGSISGAGGVDMDNSQRFRTKEYILLSDIEAISISSGYCLTWFAYNENLVYLGNGSNTYPQLPYAGVWLAAGRDATAEGILEWNDDSVYIKFAVKRQDGKNITSEDITLSGVKIYICGYPGESVYETVECEKAATIASGRQDGAIWGKYLFSFNSVGECKVYSLDGYTYLSSFVLDKNDIISPHSNSVCFGSYKYSERDEFPLLYANVYNTYKNDRSYDGMCNVYRIQRNGNEFSTTLVQIIKVGFTDDAETWCSPDGDVRPFGNFTVDTDNDKLYAFTMRDEGMTTRFFAFDLPLPTDGAFDSKTGAMKVTLSYEDVIDSFDTEYSCYVQGATCYDGKIYSLEGFTNDSNNRAAVKIIDVEQKKICGIIDLYGMDFKTEPEVVYVFDGVLHYIDVSGNIYKITFKD